MSSSTTPRDGAELDEFLNRQSPLSEDYAALEMVEPPEVLDAKVLAAAKAAVARPAEPRPAPATPAPARPKASAPARPQAQPATPEGPVATTPARPPAARAHETRNDADDDADDDAPAGRRPRWLLPAALAASALVAVGVGVTLMGRGGSEDPADERGALGSLFAERARERSEAGKAAADAAAREAEAVEVEIAPLPPPPVFEPEGPQVEDLDKAIGVIRRELLMADQAVTEPASDLKAVQALPPAAAVADSAADAAGATAAAPAPTAVIQPRNRRLAKILELYDGGNPDLAADSLEIFLRDFEDDPITQRILDSQPRVTDVAVE